MQVTFGTFKESFIKKLNEQKDAGLDALKSSDSLQDFIDAVEESDDVFELEDEVAQWVVQCEGSPLAAASWILHFMF